MIKEKRLFVGAAIRDITPPGEMMPMPFVGPVCMERVADHIHVRVLYLENAGKPALLVVFDMGEVPYVSETTEFVEKITGLENKDIFLIATHTHGVPFIGWPLMPVDADTEKEKIYRKWYELIQQQLKEAVEEAMTKKQPARLGYGTGKSYVNVNRDEKIDGKYTYGINYERPSDKTLHLIRLEDEEGCSIATIVNYAVHGVVTNGCMIGDGLWLSGDLPGRTETLLEEALGGIVLWTPAASGDQNPRVVTNFGYDESSNGLRTKSIGEAAFLILESLASEHARDVLKVNENIVCDIDMAEISSSEQNVFVLAKGAGKGDAPTIPFTLKLLKIGDLTIEGVSAEVVTTVGKTLCDLADTKHTMMITHMQGSSFYIPDDWEYEVHAQEVDESLVERDCALPVFKKAFEEMINER